MEHKIHKSYGQLGVGIFLVFAGIALFLSKLEFFELMPIWHYWPVILITIGLGRLFDAQFGWEYRKAVWMLFIGSWFLVSELHLFGLSYGSSWPILLIGIGIGMLWNSLYPSCYKTQEQCHGN